VILGDGNSVHFKASERAQALLLTGAPLREPVAEYGPFVMTSERKGRRGHPRTIGPDGSARSRCSERLGQPSQPAATPASNTAPSKAR
jgi:hypothetical protein